MPFFRIIQLRVIDFQAPFWYVSVMDNLSFLTGGKFLCGVTILTLAGADWGTMFVFNFCGILFRSRDFCE